MKTFTTRSAAVLLMLLSVGMVTRAQTSEVAARPEPDSRRLMRIFESSLRSDVQGIVESTMYNLVECKSLYPTWEYSKFDRMLDDVAGNTTDSTIAYKATLTRMYLMYGAQISDRSVFDFRDHEKAFHYVAKQLASNLLVSR